MRFLSEHTKIRRSLEIACLILISCVIFFACRDQTAENAETEPGILYADDDSQESTGVPSEAVYEEKEADPENTDKETVFVYVCGGVRNPGVYELTSDARGIDALRAAGGFSEEARTDAVNLAEEVSDGEMLRIPLMGEEAGGMEDAASDGRININTASAKELTGLPGVGDSKAAAIVDYREKNGSFGTCEELMKVPGIKEGTYASLKEWIRVK